MPYTPLSPFAAWEGPRDARIVILGEAWGEQEAAERRPFVGYSGKELWLMLGEAWGPEGTGKAHAEATARHRYGNAWIAKRGKWMEEQSIAFTNVLAFRPPGNSIEQISASRKDVGDNYKLPAIAHAKYLLPEYLAELDRLAEELAACKPNLVVALGNTACWAALRATNIGSIRGTVAMGCGPAEGMKVLPTYHPAAILRQWGWRPIGVADLIKAKREGQFAEIRRPQRQVLVNPTLQEAGQGLARIVAEAVKRKCPIACDIETAFGQIVCVSLASEIDYSICIPFVDKSRPGWHYWTEQEELLVWQMLKNVLQSGHTVLGQNFLYDLQYITRAGILPRHCSEDTMLMHHSLYPEMQKGLGFLGSIYTNEASWKLMNRPKQDTTKRDE